MLLLFKVVFRVRKLRRLRWGGGACVHLRGVKKYIQRFDGKPAGKRPLAKPMPIWEDNIKTERDGTECGTATRTALPRDRSREQAVVNAIIQIWIA